jgi:hypothetical protein
MCARERASKRKKIVFYLIVFALLITATSRALQFLCSNEEFALEKNHDVTFEKFLLSQHLIDLCIILQQEC